MNSFGLGLILNFTDNATAGMGNATRAFQQMSATADAVSSSVTNSITDIVSASYALDSVGSVLVNTGSSIISLYGDVSQSVIDAGMQMQGYRMQLSALYGSVEAGEQKIEEIKQYAMSSVFDIQSLIPAITTMKAVGIEAMSEVTTSSGQHTQKLLDYASDIAAMVPNMRNTYGTGVKAAMGALKEYIAEGNALSLKRGAGLDITGILGEDKGATIEERTQQVADLVEKLNIVGYTANLAGTPTQRLSNMQDALFNSLTKIADSGVFEKYCDLLEKLSNWVFSLVENEETFNTITGVLSDTITAILSPLESLLDFIIENSNAIIDWIKANPVLTKNILLTVAAVGALLVVGGSLLKLVASLGYAFSGLQMLRSFPKLIFSLGSAFLPIISVLGVLYGAWSTNLFGIRDIANEVVGDITFAFNNLGSIFTILSDAWGDNTLSEENFQKANDLGILPFISGLLQLKYYWGILVDGFKEGFKAFFEGLSDTLQELGITDTSLGDLVQSAKDFLSSLLEIGKEDTWSSMGEALGKIVAALMTAVVLVNLLKPVISLISGIVKVFLFISKVGSTIGGVIGKVVKGIGSVVTVLKGGKGVGFFTKLLEVIKAVVSGGMGLKDAMTVVFGSVGTTIAGVVSLISGIVMAVTGFVKQLIDGFSWFWEILKWIGIVLGVIGAILLGASTWPAIIVGAIIGAVTTIIVLIKDYWNEICNFFSTIGSWIYDNVIEPVATFFVNLWNGIVDGVMFVVNGIVSFFITIATWIYDNVIKPIVDFFVNIIYPIIAKIVEIVMKIVEIIVTLVTVFVKWIYNNVIKPIANFFVNLWNTIVDGVTAFIDSVMSIIGTIVGWIDTNIITPVATFFSNLWNGIVEGVTNFIEGVKSIFITIVSWINTNIITPIANFFSGLWEGIKTAFNVVADTISGVLKGAVNGVLSFICGIINGVISAINFAIDVINAIPGVNITKIEALEVPQLAEGGVVDRPILAEIGEDGQEAVVPLENNTGWIDKVAEKVAPKLITEQNNIPQTAPQSKIEEHNDYSVTFSAGSIVIQLSSATDAELEKAAEKLMKIIERKQQLKRMAVRT